MQPPNVPHLISSNAARLIFRGPRSMLFCSNCPNVFECARMCPNVPRMCSRMCQMFQLVCLATGKRRFDTPTPAPTLMSVHMLECSKCQKSYACWEIRSCIAMCEHHHEYHHEHVTLLQMCSLTCEICMFVGGQQLAPTAHTPSLMH